MMTLRPAASFVLYLLVLSMAGIGVSHAQSEALSATHDMTANVNEAGKFSAEKEAEKKPVKKTNYVVLPIPQSNPALGSGLTLVGLALYNPNESERPWVSGVAVMKAGSSTMFGLVQQASFMQNRLRLTAGIGHADLDLKFYGIGTAAGDRGAYIPLNQVGTGGMVQALYQVGDHWFLGLRYQNVNLKSTMDLSQLPVLGAVIPEADLRRTTASLGPAVEYDSRDDSFYPTTGTYAKANLNFYTSAFGSDLNFRQFSASWNRYWPYSPGTVVAARVSTCVVGGNVPFNDLCMYGRNNDLRGYSTGQYRDKSMLAAQAEMRWTLGHRWGAVAFGGIGSIGPSFSELLQQKMLPSIGAGLRWQASKDYKMNVSLDVAFTKDDRAVYLYVGEAF
jgi:hypothetical protein